MTYGCPNDIITKLIREKTILKNQKKNKKVIDKIYMGCGDDYKDGYVGCDVRKTKTAKIICKAWELYKYCKNVNEIYSSIWLNI